MSKQDLPLSPHLQIYKPQITSVLSIMHRITGFSLTFIVILFVLGLLTVAVGERYYNTFILYLTSYPLKLIFFPDVNFLIMSYIIDEVVVVFPSSRISTLLS